MFSKKKKEHSTKNTCEHKDRPITDTKLPGVEYLSTAAPRYIIAVQTGFINVMAHDETSGPNGRSGIRYMGHLPVSYCQFCGEIFNVQNDSYAPPENAIGNAVVDLNRFYKK